MSRNVQKLKSLNVFGKGVCKIPTSTVSHFLLASKATPEILVVNRTSLRVLRCVMYLYVQQSV